MYGNGFLKIEIKYIMNNLLIKGNFLEFQQHMLSSLKKLCRRKNQIDMFMIGQLNLMSHPDPMQIGYRRRSEKSPQVSLMIGRFVAQFELKICKQRFREFGLSHSMWSLVSEKVLETEDQTENQWLVIQDSEHQSKIYIQY